MATNASLTHFQKDFYIDAKTASQIFTYENGVSLDSKRFAEILCVSFGEKINCPLSLIQKSITKSAFVFYLRCIVNQESKYSLKCMKNDIQPNRSVKFSVLSTSSKKCDHGGMSDGRNLRGAARDDVKVQLLLKTPNQVQKLKLSDQNVSHNCVDLGTP
jgi:hypothetical protein